MTDLSGKKLLQESVERFWDAKPCGSDMSNEDPHSVEYFRDIQNQRYALEPHIIDLLSSLDLGGKRVLEIGTGVGTDARTIIGLGAQYCGINVDAGSCEATRRALNAFGLEGEIRRASATEIPYANAEFDVVYAFGVLHHIADVDSAMKEIRRVLKPGGYVAIMLYNRNSINYQIEIRHLRKWGLRLMGIPGALGLVRSFGLPEAKLRRHVELRRIMGRMSDQEWLSRNTDGPDNPYSQVYDQIETRTLLRHFNSVEQDVCFFDYRHWGLLGRSLPPRLRRRLGDRWGWHRIAVARG